jgi:hypothetical protein
MKEVIDNRRDGCPKKVVGKRFALELYYAEIQIATCSG